MCAGAELAPRQSRSVELTVTTHGGMLGSWPQRGTVSVAGVVDHFAMTFPFPTDLAVVGASGAGRVGETVSVAVTVTNPGPVTARDVFLHVVIPKGASMATADCPPTSGHPGTRCDLRRRDVVVPPGGRAVITLAMRIDAPTVEVGTVALQPWTGDRNPANDSAPLVIRVPSVHWLWRSS